MNDFLRKSIWFKRYVSTALGLFLVLVFFAPAGHAQKDNRWTVMVYMTGSDLESTAGAASKDLSEMIAAMHGAQATRVLVYAGGSKYWANGMSPTDDAIYEISADGYSKVKSFGLQNMGEPDTLSTFLSYAVDFASAERYALILWNHGGGPLYGVCFDERFSEVSTSDVLTLSELATALHGSPFGNKKLDLIGMDACLMGSLEVAYTVAPYADYMVASEELEPAFGWNYAFLNKLHQDTDGFMAGKRIIEAFANTPDVGWETMTLSCLDLSRMPLVQQALQEYTNTLAGQLDDISFNKVASARLDTKAVGDSASQFDLVDLKDMIETFTLNDIGEPQPLLDEIDALVVDNYSTDSFYNGVSIFYPFENPYRYVKPWAMRYQEMNFEASYQQYLKKWAGLWLDQSKTQSIQASTLKVSGSDHSSWIDMPLEKGQYQDIAKARLLIFEKQLEDYYALLYAQHDLTITEEAIRGRYQGTALFLEDEQGQIIAGPFNYGVVPNGIMIFGLTELPIPEDATYIPAGFPTQMIWKKTESGDFVFHSIESLNREIDMYTRSGLTMEDIAGTTLVNSLYEKPEEDLPLSQWKWDTGKLMITWIEAGNWRPVFVPLQTSNERYAMVEWTDWHGNTYATPLQPLVNTSSIPLEMPEVEAVGKNATLQLSKAEIETGFDKGLTLYIKIIPNISQGRWFVTGVTIDSFLLKDFLRDPVEGKIDQQQAAEVRIYIPSHEIKQHDLTTIHEIVVKFYIDGVIEHLVIPIQLHTGLIN